MALGRNKLDTAVGDSNIPFIDTGLLAAGFNFSPSWPQVLSPNMSSLPFPTESMQTLIYFGFRYSRFQNSELKYTVVLIPVMTALCSLPQHTCAGWSSFNQNLLGTFSAKLLLPNVKMAPVSDGNVCYTSLCGYNRNKRR